MNPSHLRTVSIKKQRPEQRHKADLSLPHISSATVSNEKTDHMETIDTSIGNIKTLDLDESSNKLRDLEILIYDTRNQLERRIKQFIEEFPGKIQRELIAIKNRDQGMWNDINIKTANLSEAFSIIKDNCNTNTNTVNEKLYVLQRKYDEADIRLISLEKSIERIENIRSTAVIKSPEKDLLEVEFKAFREQVKEDRKKGEKQLNEVTRKYIDLENWTKSQVSNLMQTIKKINDTPKVLQETIIKERRGGIEHIEIQVEELIGRLEEEAKKRIKLEEIIVKYLDEKFVSVKEKIEQETKESLEREKKMHEKVQEGLITMNDIIKRITEENKVKFNKIEVEATHLLESLTRAMENTSKGLENEISRQKEDIKAIAHKCIEIDSLSEKNIEIVNSNLIQEVNKLYEKLIESNRQFSEAQEELNDRLKKLEQQSFVKKDQLKDELTQIKKESKITAASINEQLETSQRDIKETILTLKFDLNELKRQSEQRFTFNEQSTKERLEYLNKQLMKKVDDFATRVDNSIRANDDKYREILDEYKKNIENDYKSVNEHITQEGNTIKALSRALTEKEAAERIQYVDDFAIKVTNKLSTIESKITNIVFSSEVDIKKHIDNLLKIAKEEISSELQPRIPVEEYAKKAELEERNKKIKEFIEEDKKLIQELSGALNEHTENYKREMEKYCNSLLTANENLMKEVETRSQAINSIRLDIAVKETVNDMLNLIETKDNTRKVNALTSTTDMLEKEILVQNEAFITKFEEIDKRFKNEAIRFTENKVATDATLNAIERAISMIIEYPNKRAEMSSDPFDSERRTESRMPAKEDSVMGNEQLIPEEDSKDYLPESKPSLDNTKGGDDDKAKKNNEEVERREVIIGTDSKDGLKLHASKEVEEVNKLEPTEMEQDLETNAVINEQDQDIIEDDNVIDKSEAKKEQNDSILENKKENSVHDSK